MTDYRGDHLIPDANMVFDTRRDIAAAPEELWPWLAQLGKRRAGWYAPRSIERFIPAARRALRTVDPRFQDLAVGDAIPDYGGRDAELTVAEIDPPNALIYRDQRGGAQFSWAITLTRASDEVTTVHLRFRGRIKSTGVLRWVIVAGGGFFDRLTGDVMLRGLQERAEAR